MPLGCVHMNTIVRFVQHTTYSFGKEKKNCKVEIISFTYHRKEQKKIEDSAAAESLGEQSQSSASCRRRDGTLTKKINDLQVHSGERRNRKEHVASLQSIDIENLTIVSSSWCRTTKIHSFVMYKESVRKERQHPSHSTFQFNIARLNTFSKINILFYFICSHSTYILGE